LEAAPDHRSSVQLELKIPALLDNIDDKTSRDYASHPDRMYLNDVNGKIAYAGEKGPRGFKPDELEKALKQELANPGDLAKANENPQANKDSNATLGSPDATSRQRQRASRIMSMPLISAINSDGDDKVSQSEIDDATAALKTLDQNGDGKLTSDELLPQRRRR
jgi:hypothetical protein